MKKRYSIHLFSLLILLSLGHIVSAQDTLKTDVIDVVKTFKPILSEAIKIQSNPNPEVPEVNTPVFTYNTPTVKSKELPTVYTIKPLSLGTALLPKLKTNYTRLGYGNYNTPLLEVYLNSTRSKNFQAGAYVKHLSSNPDGNRTFSNNAVTLYGKRFVNKGVVDGEFNYKRDVVHLYGATDPGLTKSDLRNQFNLYELKGGYGNIVKDTSKFGYQLNARYYNFSSNHNLKENDFLLSGTFHKSLTGSPLDVYVGVNTTKFGTDSNDYQRVYVDVNPTYRLMMGNASLLVGFNSTFFNDSNGGKLFFYPKAELSYMLIKNALTAYAGITGNMQRHTYRSIANENPFIRTVSFSNTSNELELYAGLKGLISPQTSFLLQASYATVKNLMFYAADTSLYNQVVVYDNSSAGLTNLKAELNHEFGDKFRLGFVMNYYGYDLSIAAPFSRPTFTTLWNLAYNVGDKFMIRAEIYTMDKRKTLLLNETRDVITMKGLTDINIGLDYHYSKNVSVFLNVNNLTNNQYQRWLNLPVYGINVIGGLTFIF